MSEAVQAVLAGQYAAVFAYGRAGGRLRTDQDIAAAELARHRIARDQLRVWLADDGEQADPPAPAYRLPGPIETDAQARALLASVELRLIPLYTQLVADEPANGPHRTWAIRAIRHSALAAQRWGAAGQAFPWPDGIAPPV